MKGLILKDFMNLKRQYKVLLLMSVFFIVMSLTGDNSAMFSGVISILLVMLTITTTSYDEQSKWDRYALTMPVSRSDLVIGKYIMGLILSIAAFIVNVVFQIVTGSGTIQYVLTVSAALFGAGLFLLCIILPIMFRFGVEKGRLLMMLILFIPSGAIALLSKIGITIPDGAFIDQLPYYCVLLLLLVAAASVRISLMIYKKKEF